MDGKLEQFVAVTGASVATARSLLEACGGNLDLAVNMHMEEGGGGAAGTSTASIGPQSREKSEKSYEELYGVRAPIPQTSGVLIEEDSSVPTISLRSRRLPATVFDPFQDYSKVPHRRDEVGSKLKGLSDLFKPPFDIIFTGTFAELRMTGQSRKRWLLINLQDSREFASQVLNRDVWGHEGVKSIISEHFLFWQELITLKNHSNNRLAIACKEAFLPRSSPLTIMKLGREMKFCDPRTSSVCHFLENNNQPGADIYVHIHRITDDGLKFQQLYHVKSFPYVAILDPRTGEKMADWDTITVSKFISELSEFLRNNKLDDKDAEQNDGVTEMSEEQQLKAAIEASLQDTMPKPSSKHQRIDSDEFISLSSGDEEEEGGVLVSEMEQDDSIEEEAIDRPTQSELGSHCSDTDLCSRYATNSTVCRTSSGTACLTTASENHHRPLNSRKRKSSGDNECTDDFSAPQRKVPRSSKTNAHEDAQAMGSELHVPVVSELVQNQLKPEKGAVSSRRKGKQRAASSSVVVVSVEERLELGELQKADVSQVVIRLPDGVRIQKAFLRNSPIADLFTYLTEKGIDTNQHEVMTNFPRRTLQELDPSLTFREASLCPSVTVFVQD